MNRFTLNASILVLTATITSLPTSSDVHLAKRSFNTLPLNFGSNEFFNSNNFQQFHSITPTFGLNGNFGFNGINSINTLTPSLASLDFPAEIDTSISSSVPLVRRGFNSFYPGYGLGGYGGFNSGFGSFGFPTVISNNAFNANANNFNANEFDRNKEAAVFVDNVHKKDVNSNHSNVNSHNNAAII